MGHMPMLARHVDQFTPISGDHLGFEQDLSSAAVYEIHRITWLIVSPGFVPKAKSDELPLQITAGITEFHLLGHANNDARTAKQK